MERARRTETHKVRLNDRDQVNIMQTFQVNSCLFWHLSHLRNVSSISFFAYYRLTYPLASDT